MLGLVHLLTPTRDTPTPANIYPVVHCPPPVPRPNMTYIVPARCLVPGPPARSRELTLLWMRPSGSMLPDRHCFCDPPAAFCDTSHLDSLSRNKSASHHPSSLLASCPCLFVSPGSILPRPYSAVGPPRSYVSACGSCLNLRLWGSTAFPREW
jgi:hypothetical protein